MNNELLKAVDLSAQNAGEEQGRDLLNQLLGQAQMAGAIGMFSRTVRISKMMAVKESKAYKHLSGKTPHGAELSGTWEDFCGLLGVSVDQADRDIANLKAFGEEAMEQMQRIGVGYRELAQYRKLPEDARAQLIEVAKEGDKEALLDLAESIIEKHSREKSQLTDEVTALRRDNDMLVTKNARLNTDNEKLEQSNHALKHRSFLPEQKDVPDAVADTRMEIAALYQKAHLAIADLNMTMATLTEQDPEWQIPVARGLYSALVSLSVQAQAGAKDMGAVYAFDLSGDLLVQDQLSNREAVQCSFMFDELLRTHQAEKEKREWDRIQEKPKGRGRPKAAPKLD